MLKIARINPFQFNFFVYRLTSLGSTLVFAFFRRKKFLHANFIAELMSNDLLHETKSHFQKSNS